MSYPGNSTLGDEVRQRILDTFSQSLELAESGRRQEAALGCDFILELDPEFTPARTLKERVEGTSGTPEVSDLWPIARGEAAQASPGGAAVSADDLFADDPVEERQQSADDLFDLSGLDAGLDEPAPTSAAAGGGPAAAPPAERLRRELEGLLARRDFQGVLERAGEHRDTVAADPELRRIAAAAQDRLEAQPYVESFLQEAAEAQRAGDEARARAAIDKVRSLDPDHPHLADLEAAGGVQTDPGVGETVFELADEDLAADISLIDSEEEDGGAAEEEGDLFADFDVDDLPEPKRPAARAGSAAEAAGTAAAAAGATEAQEPSAPPPSERSAAEQPSDTAPAGGDLADLSVLGADDAPAEGDDRIAQLLAEGQEAADAGDHQAAIDAWSRIFLIDVDHREASRRIDEARRLKAEREREVEEVFHEGLEALERGEPQAARQHFRTVLAKQPNHLAAREYLDQIESGEPVTGLGPSPDDTAAAGDLTSFDLAEIAGGPRRGADGDVELKEEILVPPDPSLAADTGGAADATAPRGRRAGRSGRRSFVVIGGAVLVLVLVAAWFVFQNKDRFFPNSTAEEVPGSPQEVSVIERARSLHERGATAVAVGQLKRIRPDHPEYEEAQELIAEWGAPAEEQAAARAPEISAEDLERREEILGRADRAFEGASYLSALELYDDARDIAPLDAEERERFRQAAQALEPLSEEIELFRQGEYEMIMPRLWRVLEEDPANRDARRLLVDSYFNRGVRELRRGDADRAAAEFQEALSLAPDDRDLQRHFLLAQTYQRRPKDLLYQIYVKYLPYR